VKRILFVDDEPQVLDGLRDLLRRQRHEWEMVFAPSGAAALRELEAAPFDIVVSDMRMPEMDGATLLAIVQQRFPESIRIVHSGPTALDAALRTVPVAHQCLAKPCNREDLRRAIERATLSKALLTDDAIRRAASGAEALPSAPGLYLKLVDALADPETSMADVAALVEADIALCAKVLQLVNSAFFGVGRQISSAKEAVTYLGMAPLRALALSAGAFQAFAPARPIDGFSIEALELHSALVAGLAAKLLTDRHESADAFTAGLLHDVGKLVLAAHHPDELAALLANARTDKRPLHAIEHEHAHVTHAEIGAYLLTLWGLPIPIVDAVAHHHAPTRLPTARLDPGAAVYIANLLVAQQQQDPDNSAEETLDLDYLTALGVKDRLASWTQLAAEHVGTGPAGR
jgi:HD-like signal output (HDOD) protein/CheY-like chemotaxis protein